MLIVELFVRILNWLQNMNQFIRLSSNLGRLILGSCTGFERAGAGAEVTKVVVGGAAFSSMERRLRRRLTSHLNWRLELMVDLSSMWRKHLVTRAIVAEWSLSGSALLSPPVFQVVLGSLLGLLQSNKSVEQKACSLHVVIKGVSNSLLFLQVEALRTFRADLLLDLSA